MGRMWNALRRGDSTPSDREETREAPTPIVDAEPLLVETEEIPYIEVGPHKSIEGSPSVLACSPPLRPAAPTGVTAASRAAVDSPVRFAASTNAAPAPRCVPFRTVFLATPELEAETPQNDPLAQLITFL